MRVCTPAHALALLLAASNVAAAQSSALFTADKEACFGRVYDSAHLARYPNQKVTSLHIFRSLGGRPEAESFDPGARAEDIKAFEERGESGVAAFVTFRNRRGTFHNTLACSPQDGGVTRCMIDCDGGSFTMKREAAGTVLMENNGFVLVGGCGEDVEATQTVHLSPGSDDKSFRLEIKPVAVCRAEEQKARPIPAGKPLRERFSEGERFCFGRDYDAAYLAGHPRQKIASIRVGRLTPELERIDKDLKEIWPADVKLAVTLRLKGVGGTRNVGYTCNPREADWQCTVTTASDDTRTTCDGFGVALVRGPGNDVLLVNRREGLPLDAACQPKPELDGTEDRAGITTRSDDRSFRLARMPVEACR